MPPHQSTTRARASTQPKALSKLGNGLLTLALFAMIVATVVYFAIRILRALDVIS